MCGLKSLANARAEQAAVQLVQMIKNMASGPKLHCYYISLHSETCHIDVDYPLRKAGVHMCLNPNALPSPNFDLSDWTLQLPIDVQGDFTGTAHGHGGQTLANYVHKDYFCTGSDGAMVLAAPVQGATTSGLIHARSQLREINGTANAAWSLQQGGYPGATLQIGAAPRHADGTYVKVVIGQVHGADGQVMRLAWEDGTLFFTNDIISNAAKDVHIE